MTVKQGGAVSDDIESQPRAGGFLGRQHHKLRFTELSETFLGRVILLKCPDANETASITVQLSLCDLFRRDKPEELVAKLESASFSEAPKVMESAADLISSIFGGGITAHATLEPALDYYQKHIASRLEWLKSGDPGNDRLPCIESFTSRAIGTLITHDIVIRPALLRERLGEYIPGDLELLGTLLKKLDTAGHRPSDPGPRIDYQKQVELLVEYLNGRQALTGEAAFTVLSNQMPFRWVLREYVDAFGVTMPQVGTSEVQDKIMLPLYLEVNGFLDIVGLDLESDPLEHHDVVVRYSIRKPAALNIFGASNAGLEPVIRTQLNETELALYHRIHNTVREGLVFGGKPKLESSFGSICSWLIRKASYCLQEPTFLGRPGRDWLEQHESNNKTQMEDEFFLPQIYERLRSDFGSRVVKKPERFGGEIDILFDDTIPIELKVRRGYKKPLDVADIDESYRPGGQAAAYAAICRVGIVAVLDLPSDDAPVVSLENCTVIERRFPADSAYPTCIVVIVFRCHATSPSSSR
jgi:hypothetical protein